MTTIVRELPLCSLVQSAANVRRTGRTIAIGELAASIAAHGLLQNLTVRAVVGSTKKKPANYEVVAGGRRLAALKLLAKHKSLAADAPIPCRIIEEGVSEEISLAENVGQCPMHPADQYEAFANLHDNQGMSDADIAARFGVTPAVVRQRLKLGSVSPKLMKLYRDGELNLDQLSAFTITDDHRKQEQVWQDLPRYDRERGAIMDALCSGQVASTDRRALFVGLKAYEAAGGIVIRDLFDLEGGGYLADEDLLERLAREKLEQNAASIREEGWKWVQATTGFDAASTATMRRVYPMAVKLSAAEKKRVRKLQARHDALLDKHGEELPKKVQEQLARIDAALEALERYEFKRADLALAGAVLSLDHAGDVRIDRGFVLPEDEPKKAAPKDKAGEEQTEAKAGLSNKLVAGLTAQRTAALRNELALNPAMALVATTHALVVATFYRGDDASCLRISPRCVPLVPHADDVDGTVAGRAVAERHEGWAKQLPAAVADLWEFIRQQTDEDRLRLLAHCAALTVDAVCANGINHSEAIKHSHALAQSVSLDMTHYWQPTASGYLNRVSKELVLEAVREGVSQEAASNIAGLKKQAMAEAAEQRLAGKGWLPALLRTA